MEPLETLVEFEKKVKTSLMHRFHEFRNAFHVYEAAVDELRPFYLSYK